jgi:hypothetical protein
MANSQFQYEEYVDYRIEVTEGMPMAKEGTFQFIIVKPKVDPAFTTEILYFIERERQPKGDKVIHISEFVDLYIPSFETISSKDFIPLKPYSNK